MLYNILFGLYTLFYMCSFCYKNKVRIRTLLHVLSVSTPTGVDLVVKDRVEDGQVTVADWTLSVDLILVSMKEFDVILGMNWLVENHTSIDCRKKEVIFSPLSGPNFKFKGTCIGPTPKLVSMMKDKRLVQQGGWAILACVIDVRGKEKILDTVPVVNEFSDLFLEDLPGIPSSRAIDFAIELEPEIEPISMAPVELKELKAQLKDILNKGFIWPSISPWSAPMLFVKKKDGSIIEN